MDRYDSGVQFGDALLVNGWMVLIMRDDGTETCGGVLPTCKRAKDYAIATCRQHNWRVVPVAGRVRAGRASIDAAGVISAQW